MLTYEQAKQMTREQRDQRIKDLVDAFIPQAQREYDGFIQGTFYDQFQAEILLGKVQELKDELAILEQVNSDEGANNTLGGNRSSSDPIISLSPTLNFNKIPTDKSSTQQFTIRNIGGSELRISGYTGLTNNNFKTQDWPTVYPIRLAPNQELKLQITFSPTSITNFNENIIFESNSVGGINTINITGEGVKPIDPGVESPLFKKETGSTRYFVLRNIREIHVKSRNNPNINSPYFDARETKHTAQIIADIWQCFTEPNRNGQKTKRVLLQDVVIAEGIGSFWYEDCEEFIGGLLPAYQYYYDSVQASDVNTWFKRNISSTISQQAILNQDIFDSQDLEQLAESKRKLDALAAELSNGTALWGRFDPSNPNEVSCDKFVGSNGQYVNAVLLNTFTPQSNIKIYDGRSEQKQNRSTAITDVNKPDLVSTITGSPERTIAYGYISKNVYGRLTCLSPKSGCYVTDEQAQNQYRTVGEPITKLAPNGRATLPEQIPSDPCYRGYKTKYIRGFMWEQYWAVQLNCLGTTYTEYEWRPADELFVERGMPFEVWEDVEFAGTEIGFNDVCVPREVLREQEPYIDSSDIRGCYQLYTSKVFHKYPDYQMWGMKDYIKGPEVLSTNDYSGLGPGIKLNKKIGRADCIDTPVKVYHPLAMGRDIIAGRDIVFTKGLFNHTQSLLSYSTSSQQNESSKQYHYDVVDETKLTNGNPTSYFAVAYGSKYGSGSLYDGFELNDSPSRAVYSQHKLMALDQPETEFKFYTNGVLNESRGDIYIVSFNRDSLIDRIDPGNFEISLKDFGSSTVMSFIDNSNDLLETQFSNEQNYTSFDIVSGSLINGIHDSGTGSITSNPNLTTYGKVYPNLGFVVFDALKLDNELGFNTNVSSDVDGNNSYKMFTAISGAAAMNYPMKARSSTTKKSNYYFIRVNAASSNYTNNPTMIDLNTDGKGGIIRNEYFKHRPMTYITTVGLYNDANELLAVAKLSKPIMKTHDKDILIKIRLNW
jgi:hypothetical protein